MRRSIVRRAIGLIASVGMVAVGMVAVPAIANAAPSDITVTDTFTCGLGPFDQSVVVNKVDGMNLINKTVDYPSGKVHFPDPTFVPQGVDGGFGSISYGSTGANDLGFASIQVDADTNEVLHTKWVSFVCDSVQVDLTKVLSGTSGTFGALDGYAVPNEQVYYETIGNGAGHTVTKSPNVTLTSTFTDVPWTFTPQAGDTTFDLTVKNAADDTILATKTISVTGVDNNVSPMYCMAGVPELAVFADATLSSTDHTYELKVNGTSVYGPAPIVAGATLFDFVHPAGLVPGSAYTAEQLVDGSVVQSGTTGPATGTVPNCALPVISSGPILSGAIRVGSVVTCKATATSVTPPIDYGYSWLINGVESNTLSGRTITVPASFLNRTLACRVYVTDGNFQDPVVGTSKAVKVALGLAPKATVAPKVLGTPKVGKKLTAYVGKWSPVLRSVYLYQWFNGKKAIPKATKATYTVPKALRGKLITVRITVKRVGYLNGVAISKAVKIK